MTAIVPLVEGHAEVSSVPLLLRRVLAELGIFDVQVARPFRVARYRVVRAGELERAVQLAMNDRDQAAGVLVILDADDDCPKDLGPRLLERCTRVLNVPAGVVLATRELESWFLGSKESLRGIQGIREDAMPPANPEEIRGAKEYLRRNMARGSYLKADDQITFANHFDMALARERCPSFDKLYREVSVLASQLTSGQ